jgi:citrate lyase beta subunit
MTAQPRSERSMLFVPASRPQMIARAAASDADAVCLDLEDSVPEADKAAARATAARAFSEIDFGARLRILRINGLDTAFAYRDLVDVVEAAGDSIDLIMLPKAGRPEDVHFAATLLSQIEMHRGFARAIGIEAQIETASGFLWVREIAAASPRLEALIFGPGDFAASMQMPLESIGEPDANDHAYPGHRWHAVMQAIVAAARANGLRATDGPFANLKDAAGLKHSCGAARALGFDGKQAIHPGQIATVNAVFSPSEEELAHARRVVEAYRQALAEGRGAVSLDGRMIDAANIRMARVILEKERVLKCRCGSEDATLPRK